MLAEGAKLPHLTVSDDTGAAFDTAQLAGKPLVLWFYPKDDTPG